VGVQLADGGTTFWQKKNIGVKGYHSHLEQADTGRDTRSKGLSEKLDRGMMPPTVVRAQYLEKVRSGAKLDAES